MQEQVNEKTVALYIKGAKLTGRVLAKAMGALIRQMKDPKAHHGKQSVRSLTRQGAKLQNIEITDSNIKSFERVARKYGVDFALKKDISVSPPKWLVFFKAKDADTLTSAFSEYTAKTLNRAAKRPSLLAQLGKFRELVKNAAIDRVKNKDRGGHEL